jgi:hypothetical protein
MQQLPPLARPLHMHMLPVAMIRTTDTMLSQQNDCLLATCMHNMARNASQMACTTAAPSTDQLHNCCCRQQPAATRRPPDREKPGAALPPAQEHTALAHTQARPSQRHMNHPTLLKTLVFQTRGYSYSAVHVVHIARNPHSPGFMCSIGAHPPTATTVPTAAACTTPPPAEPAASSAAPHAACHTRGPTPGQHPGNFTSAVPTCITSCAAARGAHKHTHAPCCAEALLTHNLLQQLATHRRWQQQQQQPANRPACTGRASLVTHTQHAFSPAAPAAPGSNSNALPPAAARQGAYCGQVCRCAPAGAAPAPPPLIPFR